MQVRKKNNGLWSAGPYMGYLYQLPCQGPGFILEEEVQRM